jgi:hypothetical protein
MPVQPKKNRAAQELNRMRNLKLSPEERQRLARNAGLANAGIPRPNRRKRATAAV